MSEDERTGLSELEALEGEVIVWKKALKQVQKARPTSEIVPSLLERIMNSAKDDNFVVSQQEEGQQPSSPNPYHTVAAGSKKSGGVGGGGSGDAGCCVVV